MIRPRTHPKRAGDPPRPALAGRIGALAMFLPSLALLAFALHQRSRQPRALTPFEQPDAPARLDPSMTVAGWEAVVDGGERGRVRLRLERLHPDPERQRFDALALARAVRPEAIVGGAPEGPVVRGEPWRLTLSAEGEGVVLERLAGVAVDGLEPLVPPSRADAVAAVGGARAEDVADPVAALFVFPDTSLAGGESHDLVLWGEAPAPGRPEDGGVGAVRVTLPGFGAAAELLPAERTGAPTTRAVAVLDAR